MISFVLSFSVLSSKTLSIVSLKPVLILFTWSNSFVLIRVSTSGTNNFVAIQPFDKTIDKQVADNPGFYYCSKAAKNDRNEGLEESQLNQHPTVKSVKLMQYLISLITPPGGTVLDPFTGSGSTGKAALRDGFNFIGIEMEDEYIEIARARLEYEVKKK